MWSVSVRCTHLDVCLEFGPPLEAGYNEARVIESQEVRDIGHADVLVVTPHIERSAASVRNYTIHMETLAAICKSFCDKVMSHENFPTI